MIEVSRQSTAVSSKCCSQQTRLSCLALRLTCMMAALATDTPHTLGVSAAHSKLHPGNMSPLASYCRLAIRQVHCHPRQRLT